jgi:hypothetical protein
LAQELHSQVVAVVQAVVLDGIFLAAMGLVGRAITAVAADQHLQAILIILAAVVVVVAALEEQERERLAVLAVLALHLALQARLSLGQVEVVVVHGLLVALAALLVLVAVVRVVTVVRQMLAAQQLLIQVAVVALAAQTVQTLRVLVAQVDLEL